ncbi:MAG TPA: ABC transporter permease subunit [Candidatus Dormibacteraeota bacterium]
MLRYAFRLHRWGMIGYAAVIALSTYLQGAAYVQAAGATAASRAAFGRSMSALAAQIPYLLPPPRRLDTLSGYVSWRAYGVLALVVAVWAVAAASGAVRGDEERQLVDSWLARGVSRARLVLARLAAFGAASLIAAVAGGVFAWLGSAAVDPLEAGPLAAQTLILWLFTLASFALCFLAAQLVATTRGAQMAGAGLLFVLYLLVVLDRTHAPLAQLAWLSPFKWYEVSDPLVPGGHVDAAGVLLTAAVIVGATALSALAFARRDLRASLLARPAPATAREREGSPSPLLSWPVARLLHRERLVLFGWALIMTLMAVFMVSIARSVVDSVASVPALRAFLVRGGGDPYQGFIAGFWFGTAQLLLAGFAVHLVSTWGADDTEGILAAELSAPRHRWAVLAERAAAAVIGVALLVAVGSLVTAAAAAASGTALDASAVFQASWLLVPFALTFAAVGAVADAEWPRAVVGVLGALAFASFMVFELSPLMGWPSWVTNLSVFQLYGSPLLTGINWNGLWAMVAIVVVGFGAAAVLMQRREVAS